MNTPAPPPDDALPGFASLWDAHREKTIPAYDCGQSPNALKLPLRDVAIGVNDVDRHLNHDCSVSVILKCWLNGDRLRLPTGLSMPSLGVFMRARRPHWVRATNG